MTSLRSRLSQEATRAHRYFAHTAPLPLGARARRRVTEGVEWPRLSKSTRNRVAAADRLGASRTAAIRKKWGKAVVGADSDGRNGHQAWLNWQSTSGKSDFSLYAVPERIAEEQWQADDVQSSVLMEHRLQTESALLLLDVHGARQDLRSCGVSVPDDVSPVVLHAAVSPSGQMLAYIVDASGGLEERHIIIRHLDAGSHRRCALVTGGSPSDCISGGPSLAGGSLVWTPSNQLVYTTRVSATSPASVVRMRSAANVEDGGLFVADTVEDRVIFEHPHLWACSVSTTRDSAYIRISARLRHQVEEHFAKSNDPFGDVAEFVAPWGENSAPFTVEHVNGAWYYVGVVLQDQDWIPEIRTWRSSDPDLLPPKVFDERGHSTWDLMYRATPTTMINYVEFFDSALVVFETEDALSHVRLLRLPGHSGECSGQRILFPAGDQADFGDIWPGPNADPASSMAQLAISNPFQSETRYFLNLLDASVNVLARQRSLLAPGTDVDVVTVGSHFEPELSLSCTVFGSPDRGILVRAYGNAALSVSRAFSPLDEFLIEEGWAVVFAHVRGGTEHGWGWYQSALRQEKKRSAEDLASVCHYFRKKFPEVPVVAMGASAGATTVASAANLGAPMDGAILVLPFLNVYDTLMAPDSQIAQNVLTDHDRHEYGDPRSEDDIRRALQLHCPTLNIPTVGDQNLFPEVLVIGGIHDVRAPIDGALQYALTLRQRRRISRDGAVLMVPLESGHEDAQYDQWAGRWLVAKSEESKDFLRLSQS